MNMITMNAPLYRIEWWTYAGKSGQGHPVPKTTAQALARKLNSLGRDIIVWIARA